MLFGVVLGVFAAVLAAVLAFGAWSLLPERRRGSRALVSVAAALIVGVAVSITVPRALQQNAPAAPSQIEQLVMRSELRRAATALKENDPTTFQRVLASASLLARRGEDEAAIARVRAALFAAAKDRFSRLANEFSSDRLRLTQQQLTALAETSPTLCWPIVHGNPVDMLSLPTGETLRRQELAMLERAFQGETNVADPLPTDVFQDTMSEVYEALEAIQPGSVAFVQGSPSPEQERRYCELSAEYFGLMASTPEPARLFATAEQMLER